MLACRGLSLRVTVTIILLQQQLLAEANLLQLLAQFVQFAGQLLALQFFQHQVLQDRIIPLWAGVWQRHGREAKAS